VTYSKTTVEDARIDHTGPGDDCLVADSGGVVMIRSLAPPEAIGSDESMGRPGTFVVHIEYTPNAEGVLTWDESQRDKRRLEASREMLDVLRRCQPILDDHPDRHGTGLDIRDLIEYVDGVKESR
jgi:hypothetical protein